MPSPTRHIHHWPLGAIWVGMALILWALLFLRAPLPPQDDPVTRPAAGQESAAPEETKTPTPSTEPPSVSPAASTSATTSPSVLETGSPEAEKVLYTKRPKVGAKIGTITLESLNLSWPIFEGTTEAQLSKGVGHYERSVLPGMSDNTILSGHRNTVFNRLGELEKGDLLLVKTMAGTFTYQVKNFRVVDRDDRTVIGPTDEGSLTLTTCYPFNNIGATTDAYIVTAVLIESGSNKND